MSDPSSTRATVACLSCGKLNRVDLARLADGPRCAACQRPLEFDRPGLATDATLPRILSNTSVPVLVDFYADWCGPCKVMAPVLDEFARARKGSVIVLKLDTDRNPGSAAQYQIRGIPTLVLFRGGVEIRREVGAVPKAVLERMV